MRVISIASSSKGNCTLVELDGVFVLFDLGITLSALDKALSTISISAKDITAVVISHEHSDHTKGISSFARKYPNADIYAHTDIITLLQTKHKIPVIEMYSGYFEIEGIKIFPIPLPHDSESCHGFVFGNNTSKAAIITDCGHMTPQILKYLENIPLVFLESNYDEQMLFTCNYPAVLKRRISGQNGHLSNDAAAKCIAKLAHTGTRQIVLSHLSENSNDPAIAYGYCKSYLASVGIIEGVHIKIDVNPVLGPIKAFKI